MIRWYGAPSGHPWQPSPSTMRGDRPTAALFCAACSAKAGSTSTETTRSEPRRWASHAAFRSCLSAVAVGATGSFRVAEIRNGTQCALRTGTGFGTQGQLPGLRVDVTAWRRSDGCGATEAAMLGGSSRPLGPGFARPEPVDLQCRSLQDELATKGDADGPAERRSRCLGGQVPVGVWPSHDGGAGRPRRPHGSGGHGTRPTPRARRVSWGAWFRRGDGSRHFSGERWR